MGVHPNSVRMRGGRARRLADAKVGLDASGVFKSLLAYDVVQGALEVIEGVVHSYFGVAVVCGDSRQLSSESGRRCGACSSRNATHSMEPLVCQTWLRLSQAQSILVERKAVDSGLCMW